MDNPPPAPNIQNSNSLGPQPPVNNPTPNLSPVTSRSSSQNIYKTLEILSLIFVIIFPLAGLVLGIIVFNHNKETGETNGLAVTSIIISSILLTLSFLFFMVLIIFA